jgi:hypothetical protein
MDRAVMTGDPARRARTLLTLRTVAWLGVLGAGLWFVRGSLLAAAFLVVGVTALAVGAAGLLAPRLRDERDAALGPWLWWAVAGVALTAVGLVALVRSVTS